MTCLRLLLMRPRLLGPTGVCAVCCVQVQYASTLAFVTAALAVVAVLSARYQVLFPCTLFSHAGH